MEIHRRSLIQWLAAAWPLSALRAWGQAGAFPGPEADTLRALAAVVLPSELSAEQREKVAAGFERWVREYRAGADTDHGYGKTYVRAKGPSPAPVYLKQLGELRSALFAVDGAHRQQAVEQAIEAAGVRELPRIPDGRCVAADLMSFYFRSSEANDLCYRAAIGRDQCRGLPGSEQAPPPLGGRAQ